MYEDPNVTERTVSAVFTFASDDAHDAEMRGELVDRVNALAEDFGCEVEILVGDGTDLELAFADAVARGRREILADIAAGVVPRVTTFGELHDHVDANDYAGLTTTYGHTDNSFAARVQEALDQWIRAGMPEEAPTT